MTLKPTDHEHVKFSAHRDILAAFDEVLAHHGHGVTRSWVLRQFIQEWVSEQATLLPSEAQARVMALVDKYRGE